VENNRNVADACKGAPVKVTVETPSSPTVTSSGQVVWSTRDLLFPSGHSSRSTVVTPQAAKKATP
jgi:hypothetical protein